MATTVTYVLVRENSTGTHHVFTGAAWLTQYEPTGLYTYISPYNSPQTVTQTAATAAPKKKKGCNCGR